MTNLPIDFKEVHFVVPGPAPHEQTLYLTDGTVAIWNPRNGLVSSVMPLPKWDEIRPDKPRPEPPQWGATSTGIY